MEYFLCVSFIGTLVLLTVLVVDYALDARRRPVAAASVAMPDEDGADRRCDLAGAGDGAIRSGGVSGCVLSGTLRQEFK
jgi:hypothetical protein